MQIILYKNLAEHNMLDKRPYLDKVIELNGTFRDEIDVVNPIIRIEYTTDSYFNIIDFNYVFIGGIEKYYFVDNVTIVRNNEKNESINKYFILDLSLTEDVLTTFLTNINKLVVSVNRQEFRYNDYLVDRLLPCRVEPLIEYIKPVNTRQFSINTTTFSYVLTLASGNIDYTDKRPESQWSKSQNPNSAYSTCYLFNQQGIADFAYKLIGGIIDIRSMVNFLFNNPNEAILNLVLFPLDLDNNDLGLKKVNTKQILCGSKYFDLDTSQNCKFVYDSKYAKARFATIAINKKYNNFLDYSPYTTIEIYLPFYGYATIDTNLVMGKVLDIYYVIDIISGAADIKILDTNTNDILYIFSCQLGVEIPLTSENVSEKIRNGTTTALKAIGDVITLGSTASINALNAPKKYTPRTGAITKKYARYSAVKSLEGAESASNFICDTTSNIVEGMQTHISSGRGSNNIVEWDNLLIDGSLARLNVFCRIRRLTPIMIDDYNYLVGKPAAVTDLIKNFLGYTEVSSCHIEGIGNANNTELSIIENSLKDGIIINKTCIIASVFIVDNNKTYYETSGITVTYNNSTINYKTKFVDSGNYVEMYLNVDYANQANLRIFCKNFSKTNIKSITINNGTIEVIDSSIIANTININFRLKDFNSSTNLRIAVE